MKIVIHCSDAEGAGMNKCAQLSGLSRNKWIGQVLLAEVQGVDSRFGKYRTLGLLALVLWNTVYLERAVQALRASGKNVSDNLLPHLSRWVGSTST